MVDPFLASILLCLILIAFRWRHPFVRMCTVLVVFVLLLVALDLGPASRRALENPRRKEMGPEGFKRPVSEFASGVLVMKEEAERDTHSMLWIAAALAILATLPCARLPEGPRPPVDG